jgi:hypothetical protein
MSNTKPEENIIIACDLSALPEERRDKHIADSQRLLARVDSVRELPDGYALRLPDENGILARIADFINDDRLCCPFIHFGMDVEPHRQGIWLILRGGGEIKTFLAAEFGGMLRESVAIASGLR